VYHKNGHNYGYQFNLKTSYPYQSVNAKTGIPCSVHDIIAENKPVNSKPSRINRGAVLETVSVASAIKADIS